MKKNIAFLLVMVMFSFMTFGAAQETYDVTVTNGMTTEAGMEHLDIGASLDKGGIISTVNSIFERYIDFGGLKVWKDSTETIVADWVMYAFPAGTNPDFNAVVITTLFETSEQVEIDGVNDTWETYNVEYTNNSGVDQQIISSIGETMTFDDGDWITITTSNGAIADVDTIAGAMSAIDLIVDDGRCPTDTDLLNVYGLATPISKRYQTLGEVGSKLMCQIEVTPGEYNYLIDMNGDDIWTFQDVILGYSTAANQGQNLMILDVGTYDIYGII